MKDKKLQLIFKKVEKKENGCWEFTGSRSRYNYGMVSYKGKQIWAHRLVYQLINNVVLPRNIFVCHTCDNPPCINPEHLFAGTSRDNVIDSLVKGARGKVYLNKEDVIDIANSGVSNLKLSKKYNMSEQNIGHIKSGRSWGWLTGKVCKTKGIGVTRKNAKINVIKMLEDKNKFIEYIKKFYEIKIELYGIDYFLNKLKLFLIEEETKKLKRENEKIKT